MSMFQVSQQSGRRSEDLYGIYRELNQRLQLWRCHRRLGLLLDLAQSLVVHHHNNDDNRIWTHLSCDTDRAALYHRLRLGGIAHFLRHDGERWQRVGQWHYVHVQSPMLSLVSSSEGQGGNTQQGYEEKAQAKVNQTLGQSILDCRQCECHRFRLVDEEVGEEVFMPTTTIPIPIIVSVVILVAYILVGALMFAQWEEWDVGSAAYFSFVTLTTIGFGDYVPVKSFNGKSMIKFLNQSLFCPSFSFTYRYYWNGCRFHGLF